MSKKSVEHARLEELPDPVRRAFSLGLGLFPMLPLLPGCGWGGGDSDGAGQGQPQEKGGGGQAPAEPSPAPAPTPAPELASVSGVFRPGAAADELL